MLLTLDIGNTNIKTSLFDDDQIKDFKIHSNANSVLNYINQVTFTKAAVCSVNPTSFKIISDAISSKRISIFQAQIKQKFNLKITYQTLDSLGMDRVCSTVSALNIALTEKIISERQYLITIDFGTATTLNVVSPDRNFIGGLIAPGINTMLNSLYENTAQLPLSDSNAYQGLIGRSTDSSIISGVLNATIGLINETVDKLNIESNQIPIIFVTGGNSQFILPHLKHKVNFDQALVLKGLKIIYDLNK